METYFLSNRIRNFKITKYINKVNAAKLFCDYIEYITILILFFTFDQNDIEDAPTRKIIIFFRDRLKKEK